MNVYTHLSLNMDNHTDVELSMQRTVRPRRLTDRSRTGNSKVSYCLQTVTIQRTLQESDRNYSSIFRLKNDQSSKWHFSLLKKIKEI